jgi:hypothetical protein
VGSPFHVNMNTSYWISKRLSVPQIDFPST